MKYKPLFKGGAVALPLDALDLCENILEIKLLMYLSYDLRAGDMEDSELCARLACSEEQLQQAVASLRACGLMEPERALKPSQLERSISGKDMSLIIEQDSEMKKLIDECQTICGRIFTPTDISRIVGMRKNLGYDCGSILVMFTYFGGKLGADGRKLSVSYVERSAYSLYNQGIRGFEELQSYFEETTKRNSMAGKLRTLFGMGDRAFTKKEKKFFDKWTIEWNTPFELITLAFDISVDTIGKARHEYISKIISDWRDNGITSEEAALAALEEYKKSKLGSAGSNYSGKSNSTGKGKQISFDKDEFYEKAMKRSYDFMREEVSSKKEDA